MFLLYTQSFLTSLLILRLHPTSISLIPSSQRRLLKPPPTPLQSQQAHPPRYSPRRRLQPSQAYPLRFFLLYASPTARHALRAPLAAWNAVAELAVGKKALKLAALTAAGFTFVELAYTLSPYGASESPGFGQFYLRSKSKIPC